jgi:hypothetical protein
MRLLVVSGATAIATAFSFGLNAADLAYPPPAIGLPQYGVAPPPSVSPPQVIVVPAPPPTAGASPYGVPAPAPCPPVWQCGPGGCGWQPGCGPRPERYSGPYGPPGPQVYSEPAVPPASEPYPGLYAPHVYPGPNSAYPDDRSFYRP